MKIRYYYAFGNKIAKSMNSNKLDINAWEFLRKEYKDSRDFSIEETRKEWIQNCIHKNDYQKAARIICYIISGHNWEKIVSLGVGKGILEYHLKKNISTLNIKCTDYTPDSLRLLSSVFTECDRFSVFNMLSDNYNEFENEDAVIIYRLSTEFSKRQWQEIFKKLYNSNIRNVLYIPTEILNLSMIVDEKRKFLTNILEGKKNTFCGWMYTRKEFETFFFGKRKDNLYTIVHAYKLGNSAIFELERNDLTNRL